VFGQYIDSRSFIHRLDGRAKLVLLALTVGGAFTLRSWPALAALAASNAALVLGCRVPRPVIIEDMRFMKWMLLLTAGFQLLGFLLSGRIGVAELPDLVHGSVLMLLRVTAMLLGAAWFYYSTNVFQLARVLERATARVPRLRRAGRDAATALALALRFFPNVLEEARELRLAQELRSGRRGGGSFRERIENWSAVLIPLFLNTIDRAEKLALALELRGYGRTDRPTSYHRERWGGADTAAVGLGAAAVAVLKILERAG